MIRLKLKAGKSRSLLRRHPWVFSGALQPLPELSPGILVDVHDDKGVFLARGFANPRSQIAVRVLTWDNSVAIDGPWFAQMVAAAWTRRADQWHADTTALRVVMAEADGLPGLIVDRYGDFLVAQFLSAGMDYHRDLVIQALIDCYAPTGIFERSDDASREREGLPLRSGVLFGEAPPAAGITIRENGVAFIVDVIKGHKTGHYCDQRTNRALVAARARDRTVLDAFCNSGGFTLAALKNGARHVTAIDSSGPALDQLKRHIELNGLAEPERHALVQGDVFKVLREYVEAGRRFDLIVLDPPKFASSAAQVPRATRGYKDINLLAAKLLNPGGLLASFSCSGHISSDLFQKVIFGALNDAQRDAWIIEHLYQAPDHPERLTLPESLYLKGLLLQLD